MSSTEQPQPEQPEGVEEQSVHEAVEAREEALKPREPDNEADAAADRSVDKKPDAG